MFRAPASRRRFVTTALFGTLSGLGTLGVSAAPASAQAVTMNFNSITPTMGSDYTYVANCYMESGFQVTAVGLGCGTAAPDAFAAYNASAGPAYTGSPALFLNSPNASLVDFARVGGGLFSMQSAAFSPFGGPGPFGGGATTVTFIGLLFSGSTITQTFDVLGTGAGLQTFSFGSAFTNLTSLRMSAADAYGEPVVQFDNLVFATAAAPSTVPEPATVALVAGGLFGVAAAARRRRSTDRPRA